MSKRFFIARAGRYVSVTAAEFAAHQAAQPPPPSRGLGDVVAIFAEPIARASDALLGTKLVGCNSCAERRAALNKLMPKL